MAHRRFTSKKTAELFSKKVNGEVIDLRGFPESKSNFKVKYNGTPKKKKFWDDTSNWSPEDDRDFGYPNEYWK